ncbi:MAG: SagB family peptide dehydrogenase [Betaproteobacteria bacterium]
MNVYLQLEPSLSVSCGADGSISVVTGELVVLRHVGEPAAVREALMTLARSHTDESTLDARVVEAGGVESLLRWRHLLALCLDRGLIVYRVEIGGAWLATIVPRGSGVEAPQSRAVVGGARRLSRFAWLRRAGDHMLLESPLARVIVEGGSTALAVIGGLEHATTERSDEAACLRGLLDQYGFLEPEGGEESPASLVWEFHDALFHHASRLRAGTTSGATYRMRGRLPAWPAVKRGGTGARVALDVPDADAIAGSDLPFAVVAARRQSVRRSSAPLSLNELSEFLFRTFHLSPVETGESIERVRRPVPSGGGLHELETYLAVRRCVGLPTGSYWYDSRHHELETLGRDEAVVQAFTDQASRSWGWEYPPPDVLITIAARVPRVAWKYEGNAYRVVLLDAGVMMQMMYLVATAMGLAPCAIGNGDPALFAALTGCDPFEETSVGEFALSGRTSPAGAG